MEKYPELHTPDQVHHFVEHEVEEQEKAWHENYDHILRAKNAIWLLLLVVAFLEFHLIDVMVEVGKLEVSQNNVFRVQNISCRPMTTRM
ncbi:MAG: hypothetical protein M0P39_01815 [Rhodocyclaceae bacterium]|jgi:hypothetical protein|nr:hypothetical protein [Rhodocyclaceae bacterium]